MPQEDGSKRQGGRLSGRVVAITGGARGIGLATAESLVSRGARVAIGDIDSDAAAAAADGLGSGATGIHLDVADPNSFADFLAAAEERLGPVDVLVNNAGIMPIGPLLDEPAELARRVMEINVLGVLNGMRLALPAMLKRGDGQIINVSSVAGKSPVPGGASYAASKAAVVSLTETARVEYTGSGVDFTCVMPSFTNTELIAGTAGTRFMPTLEAADVGEAIARAVEHRRKDVYVPRAVGAIIRSSPLLGRRLRDKVNHSIGADRVFLDHDAAAREAYHARIKGKKAGA